MSLHRPHVTLPIDGRRARAVLAAALTLATAVAMAGVTPAATGAPPEEGARKRVIVTLTGKPAMAAVDRTDVTMSGKVTGAARARVAKRRATLRATQQRVLRAAERAGVEAKQRHAFTGLLNAVALSVPASEVSRLDAVPGVQRVVPDRRMRAATDVSVPLVGAPQVWKVEDADGSPVRGEGTTVAIIDTGVDYTHPALGGGFGPGHKVVAGYDFVNDDGDPIDDNGHGTHVAGIVAGDGTVTGVAPDAALTAYKVISAGGTGFESDVIAGLEAAVDPANPHRADVVNMSLSGPGDGTGPIGTAATNATEMGVVVVASAGNSGPGAQTMGTPAVAEGVLTVGASVSGIRMPTARMTSPQNKLLETFRAPFSANPPEQPVSGELVDVGAGTAEDYQRVGDVTGKVVAYRARIPGDVTGVWPGLIEQARRAEDRGAVAALAYTSSAGPVSVPPGAAPRSAGATAGYGAGPGVVEVPLNTDGSGDDFRMEDLVVLGLADLQWQALQRRLSEGTVEVEISGEDVTDQIAAFSSRGPTSGYDLEPDLVAPGVEIRSTWPKDQWEPGVYRLSGTSMSAPHVAGAAALLRQLYPDAGQATIGSRLVGSATAVEAVPTTAGSGRLDVAAAASTQVVATPASLSFGLADLSQPTVSDSETVTLRNTADEPVSMSLSAQPGAASPGEVTVSPSEATIPAGGEVQVRVSLTADRPNRSTDLTGLVVADVAGAQTPNVRVPYLLAARPLIVRTSPDPSSGRSEAFVWSPVPVQAPPVLTVTPPHGPDTEVTTEHDHGNWYRAELRGKHAGVYDVHASAAAEGGLRLVGDGAFEVVGHGKGRGPRWWQPIGPNAAAGQIATTPADQDVAVLTQYQKAGPWTTDDGGQTWRQHNSLPVAAGTGSGNLVVDAQNPKRMWYAVNGSTGGFFDITLDPTYEGRVLRTTDGGRTWQTLDGVPNAHVAALVSDAQTRALMAVTADSVLVSRDGGDTWTTLPNPAEGTLVDAAVGGDDVYLATSSGVWVLRGLVTGAGGQPEQVYDAQDPRIEGMVADAEQLAVLTGEEKVLASRDGGQQWQLLYDVPEGDSWNAGTWDILLAGDDLVVTTYREVAHLGRDHGSSWSVIAEPVPAAVESDVVQWNEGLLWTSPGAGMFRTEHDGSEQKRIGVQGATAYDLAVTRRQNGKPQLLAGTDADVYRTPLPRRQRVGPRTTEWGLSGSEAYVGARVAQLAVSPQDPQTVWKVRKDALSRFWVYRSTDGGAQWQLRGRTNEVPLDIMVSPHDPQRVVVPFWSLEGTGLYVTDDAGKTWQKQFHDQLFTTVAADPNHPGRLWLGSPGGLYRSDDFGATVHKLTDGQVAAIGIEGDRIVLGGATIRLSRDGGQSFRVAEAGDLQMRVSDVLVSPKDSDTWYAATTGFPSNGLVKGGRGVLRSTDGGRTWVNVSRGLQNLEVASLTASPSGRWLYAGTVNGGVHRLRMR